MTHWVFCVSVSLVSVVLSFLVFTSVDLLTMRLDLLCFALLALHPPTASAIALGRAFTGITATIADAAFHALTPPPPAHLAATLADLTNAEIPSSSADNVQLLAHVAKPKNPPDGPLPVLVLIHEFFGLNENIVAKAQAFADECNCVCIAPDTFRGVSTTFIPRAIWLALTTPQERVNADITDIIDWAGTAVENVDTSRVAVAGFCYGGGKALRYCAKQRVDAAAVVFYGSPLTDPLDYVDLRAPVLGIFGTEDVQIPQRKVDQFRAAMEEAGVEHEVQSYYGVGHAFWSDMGQIDRQEMPQFAAWGLATNFLKTFFEGRESFSRRRAFLEFMLQEEGRGELYEGGDETLAAEDTDVVNDGSESDGGPDTGP